MGKVACLVAASGLLVLTGCGDGAASGDSEGSGADGGVGTTGDAGSGAVTGGTSGSGKAGSGGTGAMQGLAGGPDETVGGTAPEGMGGAPPSEAGAPSNEAGMPGNEAGAPSGDGGMPGSTGGTGRGGSDAGGSDPGGSSNGGSSSGGSSNGGSSNSGSSNGGSSNGGNGMSGGGPNPGECDGKNDGAPCGDASSSECDQPDSCARGVCEPNYVGGGTECGGKPENECDAPSQCDGAGKCEIQFKKAGSPCGDQQTDTTCDKPDTCDGSGSCEPNLADFLVPCGDSKDSVCDNPDFCDGDGSCDQHFEPKGTSCGSNTSTACNKPDSCDGAGTCLANFEKAGTACGSSADTQCDNPDKCNDSGTCQPNYEPVGTPCGSASVNDCSAADSCSEGGVCSTNHAPNSTSCEDCAAGIGQCDGCSSGSCTDSTLCPNTSYPLATGYATNSNAGGIMFDMTAAEEITIRGFDVNILTGPHTVNVYVTTTATSYVGVETTAASWTLLKSYPNVTGSAAAGATSLPRDLEYTLGAGQSRGFFIVLGTTLEQRAIIGSEAGAVYANDGLLQIKQGIGKGSGGFAGIQLISPRVFSGAVHYTRSITTTLTGGNAINGVMFDVDAASDTRVRGLQVQPAGTGTYDVELWYRNGTHVGHESSQADWTLVDVYASVPMVVNEPLRLPLVTDMIFEAGSTHALYVTTGGVGSLRATIGSATGTALKNDGRLTIRSGTGKTYPFALSYGNREPNITLEYDSCPDPTPN